MGNGSSSNATLNFPIAMIPDIWKNPNNWQERLRDWSDFAIAYYADGINPDVVDVAKAMKELQISGNKDRIWEKGTDIYLKWRHNRSPLTSLGRKHYWAMVDIPNLSEIELISFCAYLALRSICRKRNVETRTTINMIFARMEGKIIPDGTISPDIEKWTKRRQFDNIKRTLSNVYDVEFKEGKTRGIIFKIVNSPSEKSDKIEN